MNVVFVIAGEAAELIFLISVRSKGVVRQVTTAVNPTVAVLHYVAVCACVDITCVIARCCEWVKQAICHHNKTTYDVGCS